MTQLCVLILIPLMHLFGYAALWKTEATVLAFERFSETLITLSYPGQKADLTEMGLAWGKWVFRAMGVIMLVECF